MTKSNNQVIKAETILREPLFSEYGYENEPERKGDHVLQKLQMPKFSTTSNFFENKST